MRVICTIGLIATLATVSCGGSSVDPVINPAPASITGTVEITGALLADFEDLTSIGEQTAKNWSVKLIDPVEDVDSIVIPVANTTFNSGEVTVAGEYLLSINLQPALDLSGGSAATTPVAVSIPVTVSAGEITQVFATVEVLPPMVASAVHTASQLNGGRLRLRYAVETSSLRDTGYVDLDWNNKRIRHDTNHDEQFDDEEYFADSDRDGISDEYRDQMRDRMHWIDRNTIEGVLSEIDTDLHHHRILVGDGWYLVNERTKVKRLARLLNLSHLEVGQDLSIIWRNGSGDIRYAEEIRIIVHMDRPPMGP